MAPADASAALQLRHIPKSRSECEVMLKPLAAATSSYSVSMRGSWNSITMPHFVQSRWSWWARPSRCS